MPGVTQTIASLLQERVKQLSPASLLELEKVFNECCLSISYTIVQKYGVLRKKGSTFTFDGLVKEHQIAPGALYVLDKMLFILTEEEILEYTGDEYRVIKLLDPVSPEELLVSFTRRYPPEGASYQWLARAYAGLPGLFKGTMYPEDILFPWGSFDLVEDLYCTSKTYGFFPVIAGYAVQLLKEHLYHEKISCLEIGAGTGNGTAQIPGQTHL